MSRCKQRVKGTNAVGHRVGSKPKKKNEEQDEEELLQDKWTSWRPERVTDEGYATSEYISCALRMHESIYSTTRSCEPLLNRAAFSFRSPFMGRNLRSLKRRHGTTRADLYTARLSFHLSLFLSFSLPLLLSHSVSHYAFRFMGILWSMEYTTNVISWRRGKRLSRICVHGPSHLPPSWASITDTRSVRPVWYF